MENIIREIIIAAQGLDNRGHHEDAEKLDKIASALFNIKTAQYDGTQGYFIRNTRCWNGCVRIKRAEGLTPNEAWSECHDEWMDASMGQDTDSWNKYAEEDGELSKTAMASSEDVVKIAAADSALASTISERISNGLSAEDAIPMTLAERSIAIAAELSKCAQELDKIASRSDKSGTSEVLSEMAEKISDISAEEYIKSISN